MNPQMYSDDAVLQKGLRDALAVLKDRLLPDAPVDEIENFGWCRDGSRTLMVWIIVGGDLCSIAIEAGRKISFLNHGTKDAWYGDADDGDSQD
ncbi:MAG: hypothetical protein WB870_06840 [Gallionellaceae bacterium]